MLEVRKYYQKGRALLMRLLVDDTAEERISELKGISIETSKIEKQNEKSQFKSVAQSCLILYDPMNHSTPGLPAHH